MKKLFIILFMTILLSCFVTASLTTDLEQYFTFDNADLSGDDPLDLSGNGRTGTSNNIITGDAGLIGEAFNFSQGSNYVDTNFHGVTYGTISLWIYTVDIDPYVTVFLQEPTSRACGIYIDNLEVANLNLNNNVTAGIDVVNGSWVHLVALATSINNTFWINGVYQGVNPTNTGFDGCDNVDIFIGYDGTFPVARDFDGYVDEWAVWNRSLTNTEIAELYNGGAGLQYPFSVLGNTSFNKVKITNNFTGANLQNVNITLNNSVSNLTQADGIAYFSNLTGSSFDFSGDLANYFNITGVSTENDTVYYTMFQSVIDFNCLQKISDVSLTCLNSTIHPDADTYNLSVAVASYFNVIQEETITALDNKTINITGFYYANLTFFNNFVTGLGNASTTCLYNVTSSTYPSFNEVINGANGSSIGLINGSYIITVDCDDYAYTNETVNITVTVQNVTFDLYSANSIDIFIFDETSGISLNGTNITVIKTLGAVQEQNYTSTGTVSYSNLTAGNYTFSFEGSNYPRRNYAVTIGNKTYQTLNVYLLANSTDTVIFTFQEYGTNQVIEGVTETINKIINGSDTLIAVLTSDITGRTQFYFDATDRYCFTVSKPLYVSKAFCLDPIIFNSYTISLETSADVSTGDDYEQLLISYTPARYWNNQNNTITFQFASPPGDLTNYGFNATYKTNVSSASGTNAFGGVITDALYIKNSQYGDTVTVNYFYKKSGDAEYRTFKLIYDVYGYNSTTDSLVDNPPDDYGLGEFEKTLISIIIILLVAGASAFYGGALAGGVMALFMFAWVMYIGFLNFWAGAISIILLFVIVAWRSTK